MQAIPGATESDSNSYDSSFDYCEYKGSNNTKCENYHEAEALWRHYYGYCNSNCMRRSEGYDHVAANSYYHMGTKSNGSTVGAIASQSPDYKKEGTSIGATKHKMIEVAPGEFMRLRGAHETWQAIQNDFYIPCGCICCNLMLFCIQDATYVLCSQCQVVNPEKNGWLQ